VQLLCDEINLDISSNLSTAGLIIQNQIGHLTDLLEESRLEGNRRPELSEDAIRQWVSTIDVENDQFELRLKLGQRYQDSGQWLLSHVAFQKWRAGLEPHILWLRGTGMIP
jgi:hypothetical protein